VDARSNPGEAVANALSPAAWADPLLADTLEYLMTLRLADNEENGTPSTATNLQPDRELNMPSAP